MNNKKTLSSQWAILPLLFCSATVLAGDGGYDAPYGKISPQSPAPPLTLEGNAQPDTMKQAQRLGQESDGFVDDSTATTGVNTGYVGGNTRIGIGVDTELKGKLEASQVFSSTDNSATLGQGYLGVNPKADDAAGEEMLTGAGAKISHHWVSGDANNPTRVNKVFGAYDQNERKDKKATLGYGQENANLFWSGHVSKGLSDGRVTTTPGLTEKAYDLGVGGRVGAFLPEQAVRLQGGLDYEWAENVATNETRAAQTTLTGGVEKFFPDTPHSVGAEVEIYKKAGGALTTEDTEARGGISYRYDIGSEAGVWQPEQRYRRIRTEIPGEQVKKPPKIERKLIKNTMELEADTFFKLDSAKLTPEAQQRLKAIIAQIRGSGYEGNIRITGNTCDKGSDAHNQKLSENRANAVRDFMIKNGFSANTLQARGLGESQPKYPNTDAEGHKNRRVDIEYVTYQNEYKDEVIEAGGTSMTDPKVVWRKELIPEPPIWVRQALHNTADHKQTVDTYKTFGINGSGNTEGNNSVVPVAVNDSATTTSGTPVTIAVLANDSDPNGDPLSLVSFNQGTTGAVTQVGNDLVYTPIAGFTGTDTFTYIIADPAGNQSTATVTVTVGTMPSDAVTPVAGNDSGVTTSGVPVTLDVLANDVDPNGDSLSIASFNQGINGAVAQVGNNLVYTPVADFAGTDTFTYSVTDPAGNQSTATVTVTVNPSKLPVAVDDTALTLEGEPVTIDVLGNDNSPTGAPLTVSSYTNPANGTVTQVGSVLTYTPNAAFVGTDVFTYVTTDPEGHSTSATVTVTVASASPSESPVAMPDTEETTVGKPVTVNVLSNDKETVSIASFTQSSNGTLTQEGDHFVYTPNPDFIGTDTFTYIAQSADGRLSNETTVTITVKDANAAPIAKPDAAATTVGKSVAVNVLANDEDTDGDVLSVISFTQGTHGQVTQEGNILTYVPDAAFTGTDHFEYAITDGKGHQVTATVTITVTAPVNPLKAVDDNATKAPLELNDLVPRRVDVLANDTGDELQIVSVGKPDYGTAEIITWQGKQMIRYTLRSGYCLDHSFPYTVRDKDGNEATAYVFVDVEPAGYTGVMPKP